MADPDLIIHINGWPGCGKLTIGRELAKRLGARHKLTAPMVLASLRANYRLLRAPGLPLVELDVSDLAPEAAAAILAERCRSALELGRGNAERAR